MQPTLRGASTTSFRPNPAGREPVAARPRARGVEGGHARAEPAAPIATDAARCVAAGGGACPACAAAAVADAAYAGHAFATALRAQRSAEAIADTLGYCGAHTLALLRHPAAAAPIAAAAHGALARWSEMLGNEVKFGDRIIDLCFHAGRDCPACRFAERAAAHVTTGLLHEIAREPTCAAFDRLERLCLTHFKHLYVDADSAVRERVLPHYRETLDRALDRHNQFEAPGARDDRLLNSVAGDPGVDIVMHVDEAAASTTSNIDDAHRAVELKSLLRDATACPVCLRIATAQARWLAMVRRTLRTGQPAWLTFPSCAQHVRAVVALHDPALIRMAASHAGAVALEILARRLPPFTPTTPNELELFARPRVQRRRGKHLPAKTRTRPHALVCVACERMAVAREAAIGELLELLQSAQQRAAYAQGHGLCLRHFASAYLVADRGATRPFLTAVQRERLAQAGAGLGDAAAEGAALLAALARLGGRPEALVGGWGE